ncbi:MAG: DUF1343 domain-containing protein [Bacillota bacterium]|nr:DUF1343 domain-containing protein [Bacillota bacterium]
MNGIDRVVSGEVRLPDRRYGLVTAAHARTGEGRSSRLALGGHARIACLFSPEHGLDGVAGAGDSVGDSRDGLTGLPVYSLYRQQGQDELIPAATLDTIDAFLYDLPDIGVRFYTYISTCLQVLEIAARTGKAVFILDRPNPLGGLVLEGLTLAPEDFNFIGPYSLPIRYGLTIGELATLYAAEQELELDLEVIRVAGWRRGMLQPDTGQVFTIPSPNIPNWQTALCYPGTCLIEGTNLSEGRGTPRPFTWFGAPWIRQEELARILDELPHPGLAIRPQGYIPTASKQAGLHCQGIALEITDAAELRSVAFMVRAIDCIRALYPDDFRFIAPEETSVAAIRRHMGRSFVEDGWQVADFAYRERKDHAAFRARVAPRLLYEE